MFKFIEQTLVEQLNISDHEIEYRKHLFDFTETDVTRLLAWRDYMADRAEELTAEFYARQVEKSEVATIIGDAITLKRLHTTFHQYLLEMFGGIYDKGYVEKRLRIGKVHRRIGVTPKLYMSSMRLMQSLVDTTMDEAKNRAPEAIAAAKDSVHKIMLLDAQFIFDAYIDCFILDVDAAKNEVNAYANSLEIRITEHTRELREISVKDSLTGLYNRRALTDFLLREIAVAKRYKLPLSVIYLDLNKFKEINDKGGHDAGDGVLARVGKIITDTIRQIDFPCRYGGDEFCIILPRTDITGAVNVSSRLIEHSCELFDDTISYSVGIFQSGPEEFYGQEKFLRKADDLMYLAKQKSRISPGYHVRTDPQTPDCSPDRVSGEATNFGT